MVSNLVEMDTLSNAVHMRGSLLNGNPGTNGVHTAPNADMSCPLKEFKTVSCNGNTTSSYGKKYKQPTSTPTTPPITKPTNGYMTTTATTTTATPIVSDEQESKPPYNNSTTPTNTTSKKRRKKTPLYYPDYLKLDQILSAQQPRSAQAGDPCHDEMLFITIHQTYELWFKQLIYELDSVCTTFEKLDYDEKGISLAFHRLSRIKEIQKLLIDQINVLDTMTPQEFLDFRQYLFPASGFQSYQFRLLEIKLGVRSGQRPNKKWINTLAERHRVLVEKAEREHSLFDFVERWLRNIPFRRFRGYNFAQSYKKAVEEMFKIERESLKEQLGGDCDEDDEGEGNNEELESALQKLESTKVKYESVYNRSIHDEMVKKGTRRMGLRATEASLMILLYQDMPMLQLPARLLRMLVEVDELLNQWRYRHSQMVHKMIGAKIGTGGSLGHSYLKATVDSCRVFADLANLSTLLIPRRLLPDLPANLRDQMRYFHTVEQYDRTLFEIGGGGDSIDWSFC